MNLQLIKAVDYYRRKGATGYVVLANGQPYHFPGKSGKEDAQRAIDNFNKVHAAEIGKTL